MKILTIFSETFNNNLSGGSFNDSSVGSGTVSYVFEDLQILYIGLVLFGVALFCLLIAVSISIVRMNFNLKRLVDLEYKKYNELKGDKCQDDHNQ